MVSGYLEIPREKLLPKSVQKPSLFKPLSQHTFLDCMIEMYHSTLDATNFKEVTLPTLIATWAREVYEQCGQDPSLVKEGGTLNQPTLPYDKDFLCHLVTGGKDSTATVLKYNDTVPRIELLHVTGVNKIYPTEHLTVNKLYPKIAPNANLINLKVNFPRVSNASESPVKLMVIMALAIDLYKVVPRWITLGGSAGIADVSEVEVYGDSGKAIRPFFDLMQAVFHAPVTWTPYLRDQIEAYELTRHIPAYEMCSCFSQLRFKSRQRSMALDKYSVKIEGRTFVAGTVTSGTRDYSIFELPVGVPPSALKVSDLHNIDEVIEDDYRCIGGCFKCRERCVVNTNHFGFHYHPDYVTKSKEGIISWMDKSPNNNGVKLDQYFTFCLRIPLEDIPSKYYKYIAGEATRPDGWKPPKVAGKKK